MVERLGDRPRRDGVVACDASGLVVGHAVAMAPHNFRDAYAIYLEGCVRPDHRGRGAGRACWSGSGPAPPRSHAERQPGETARLVVPVPAAIRVARGAGAAGRAHGPSAGTGGCSDRSPTSPSPATSPGVDLVPFTWDRDDEVRRAHNAAFTEHHGSAERDAEAWKTMFTGQRAFRPELSVLAVEDGAVVGYVLAYEWEADSQATGVREANFGQIGVLPRARGRGMASAVIAAALRAGAEPAAGGPGSRSTRDNVTGALRLYESLGFATTRTSVSWSLALPPLSEPRA